MSNTSRIGHLLLILTCSAMISLFYASPITAQPSELTSEKLDVGFHEGRIWTDINKDGKADFCRITDGTMDRDRRLRCTLATGTGFGGDVVSFQLDSGYKEGRAWADFNGDELNDYFRVVDDSSRIKVTLSDGTSFSREITSGPLDLKVWQGRATADFNGDGRSDYCWVHADGASRSQVSCALSAGDHFGKTITSNEIEVGYSQGRTWADVNGDGKADYCRVVDANGSGGKVRCTLSAGTRFGSEVTSKTIDAGYHEGRAWRHFFGSKRTDYCRIINDGGNKARCIEATNDGAFGGEVTSKVLDDAGYHEGRDWPDYNADSFSDYCRVTKNNSGTEAVLACTPSLQGRAFGDTTTWGPVDPGYFEGRAWVDVTGNGRPEYCRVIESNNGQGRVRCTLLN